MDNVGEPSIADIGPITGLTFGGTSVTIAGSYFGGATAVMFGTTPAASFTVNSATQITATSPAGTGTVDVTVIAPGGTTTMSSADQFTYLAPTTPTITWSNPTDISYGVALGNTQLDAMASLPGSFVYTPAAGTVPHAGNGQSLSVTFTPTDTIDYTTATKSVSIDVLQVTPTISWSNPADISYGAALGSAQLDATASLPGSFVYTPAAGTVPHAGNGQSLSVTFTPTDTINYTTATKSVSINVLQVTDQRPSATVVPLSGTQSGNVTISYSMFDPESDPCSIQVQYSLDGGGTWNSATPTGGDGMTGLAASPSGVSHTFVWASGSDIVNTNISNVEICITPSDSGGTGTQGATNAFTVNNYVDTTPPTPNPSTWATFSNATDTTSISMTATAASDPEQNGVQYFFHNLTISWSQQRSQQRVADQRDLRGHRSFAEHHVHLSGDDAGPVDRRDQGTYSMSEPRRRRSS